MSKIRAVFAFFLIIVIAVMLNAHDTDVTGDWELILETPRGEMKRAIRFEQKGEVIAVAMETPQGDEALGEGTLKGDDIAWTITRDTPQGEFTLKFSGTVEGDSMSGKVERTGGRIIGWSAKRI